MCSVPVTWYWKCGASHSSVPAIGLTSCDQRQPGARVSRPISAPPIWIRSTAPWVNVRVSSGVWKLFCSALPVMVSLLLRIGFVPGDQRGRRWLQPPCTELVAGATPGFNSGMRSLAVRVLSDFGVDGIEPQALGSRKARLALQLLAMAEGQAVPAGVLIDALWGAAPPARPEDQVAVLMSRLRSVLGRDRIEHRDRGYLLRCDWLDATELAGLTAEMESRRQAGDLMGAVDAALLRAAAPI